MSYARKYRISGWGPDRLGDKKERGDIREANNMGITGDGAIHLYKTWKWQSMILIIDSDDDGESLVWECLEQKRTVAVMKAQGVIEKKSIAPTQSVGNRKRNPSQ